MVDLRPERGGTLGSDRQELPYAGVQTFFF